MALKARILRLEARQPVNLLADLSEAELETMLAQLHVLRAARNDADLLASRAANRYKEAQALSFRDAAEAYIAAHRSGWRNPKHAAQWESTLLTYAYPAFGELSVEMVDIGLVMKVLEPIWASKTETASRLRGRIEAILGWATVRGHRTGENPARWRGHLENLLPKRGKVRKVVHHPALPYGEIADFMQRLHSDQAISARALEFLILTASRTNETLGAKWDEINTDQAIWTVPAERIKTGRVHRVPLSKPALALLRPLQEHRLNEFVFPGAKLGRPLSNMALLALLKRMGRGDLTSHGFRSTFRDWAAEQTDVQREIPEMALAHAVSDKVEAAYRRGDLFEKRRLLMEKWAEFASVA